jgi:hypothetical protein
VPLKALGNSTGEVIGLPFEFQIVCVLVAHAVVSPDNPTRISLENSGLA